MNPARFLRSVRHTKPTQLLQRARRIVRCRIHDRWPGGEAMRAHADPPPVNPEPPSPLFTARRDRLAPLGGMPQALFLNITMPLGSPVDWKSTHLVELQAMNLHYMEFLEAVDDNDFVRLVQDWIDHNPVGERDSWRVAWNSFVVSLRSTVWIQQLALRRGSLPAAFVQSVHRSLAAQLRFLERHLELDIGGNHLIKNAKALLWGSRYFSGPEADRWRRLGHRLLCAEIDEQVLPDGMHYELSPAYHLQVFADLLECLQGADPELREPLHTVLRRMAQVVADLTHPDGAPSLFNDGGLHMTYSPQECLSIAESLGVPTPQPRHCFSFPQAGYFGCRSDATYVLLDCGPVGPDHLPAHGHGDLLSFEWTLSGQRFIVDAGVLEYERGPWRDLARATTSHNTLTLDDFDQSEFWAAFRVGRRARSSLEEFQEGPAGFMLAGSHDGYRTLEGSPRHWRRFTVTGDRIDVEDRVTGGAGQQARARLLLSPEVTIESASGGLRLGAGGECVLLSSTGAVSVEDAWWFPDFGVKLPTRRLAIDYGPAPCHGCFQLVRTPRH